MLEAIALDTLKRKKLDALNKGIEIVVKTNGLAWGTGKIRKIRGNNRCLMGFFMASNSLVYADLAAVTTTLKCLDYSRAI